MLLQIVDVLFAFILVNGCSEGRGHNKAVLIHTERIAVQVLQQGVVAVGSAWQGQLEALQRKDADVTGTVFKVEKTKKTKALEEKITI